MNPYEEKLRAFATDEIMFNAVKGALLGNCDLNHLFHRNMKDDTPNSELYDIARGWWQARELIRKGFKDLETYRYPQKSDGEVAGNII